MEHFIARQPIFNASRKLHAYELLYRGAPGRMLDQVSGEKATASLLSSVFLTRDVDDISSNRPCFVNFTQKLLEDNLPLSFPKHKIVVEILESVEPTPKVISVCRGLAETGYSLALDDFVYHRRWEPLLEIVKIVKIDVRLTPLKTLVRTLNLLGQHRLKLLAEKVETEEEFNLASRMGFSYFQGYFFCRPEKIGIKEISSVKVNLLRLLDEVTRAETEMERLRDIIISDVAITYKLMRFLNSAYFYRLEEVKSVMHAVAYLGERELRRFVMLVIISELATDKPVELVRLALVRAKFCELLGGAAGEEGPICQDLYLIGLFSLLDAMLEVPMHEILGKVQVSPMVRNALLGQGDTTYIQLCQSVERGDAIGLRALLSTLDLTQSKLRDCYLGALRYANNLA